MPEDQFEIAVGECVVQFYRYEYNGRFIITVTASPDDCDDSTFYYESEVSRAGRPIIGSLELSRMPEFDAFRDHMTRVVPEEARRRGVEPYHLSEIYQASRYCDYEEAVVLTVIGAGDWEEFTIQIDRSTDVDMVRRMRATIKELRQKLAQKIEFSQSL
jgi:predicted NodU family carbamoyl transferase